MTTIVDPPSGWMHGFPKPLSMKEGQSYSDWLRVHNYPEELIPLAEKHSRYWDMKDE